MQFTTTTLIAILSALAVASPIEPRQNATAQQERLCTSAIDTAMCCQTTLAGVINQTCTTPAITPINKQAFRAYCAAQGQDSSCCKTPLVGDGVICTPP
ncbi:Bhp3 [Botrytis cinerea B05.10]|uniref:Class II hydrophobin 3 n=2 Tax=Botryotinia fuckeliana TaxID=40559 RepID=BHP3_BOTFB|nr:Bhp3 [Botrytis cinerea B05.10]ATZ50554.1 Bhp3 [Botrytis cinerea B05.10]CCD49285.1 Bhp3, hydrophobin class II [Botrytis cinerea T4]